MFASLAKIDNYSRIELRDVFPDPTSEKTLTEKLETSEQNGFSKGSFKGHKAGLKIGRDELESLTKEYIRMIQND